MKELEYDLHDLVKAASLFVQQDILPGEDGSTLSDMGVIKLMCRDYQFLVNYFCVFFGAYFSLRLLGIRR